MIKPSDKGSGPAVNLSNIVMIEKANYHETDWRIQFWSVPDAKYIDRLQTAIANNRHNRMCQQPAKCSWFYDTEADRDAEYERVTSEQTR